MIMLEITDRSPNLAELKVSYRRRRPRKVEGHPAPRISTPQACDTYLRTIWDKDTIELREEIIVLYLNAANEVLGWIKIATGGIDQAFVDPRLIFGVAVQVAATGIIISHNHPTGSRFPSEADRTLTRKIFHAGETLGIRLLDHLIITKDQAYSFAQEEGLR
jgi:DNA repair protein RadC